MIKKGIPYGVTGHLIKPYPFQEILKSDCIMRRSPLTDWVLLQRENAFEWMNYEGTKSINMKEWHNEMSWSPDKKHAAKIEDNKIVIIRPVIPEEF